MFIARLCTAGHSCFCVAAAPKSDVMQGQAESVTLPTCTSPDSDWTDRLAAVWGSCAH